MKNLLLVVAVISNIAFAADQNGAVNEMVSFMGTSGPALYQGQDDLGNCRLFFYTSRSSDQTDLSFEGTFLNAEGAAVGMVIPFLLSSDSRVATLEKMTVEADRLVAAVLHHSQEQDLRIVMALEKDPAGNVTTISYEVPAGLRICRQLKRIL